MSEKVYCSECGKEIGAGQNCFITYVDAEDPDRGIVACEQCNRKVYTAS